MGSDGGGGGFFHLFDWNRKSRKKLFPSGHASSGKKIQGNKSDNNMIDQDHLQGVAATMAGSHCSVASMTNEEGSAFKTPGVIARLMGLDYIPASGISAPYSTPSLCDSHSLQVNSQERGPEMYANGNVYHVTTRSDSNSRKPELKTQKMVSSPIEKFQIETLPPRMTKTIALTNHKVLSPVKNPGFISTKNASYIIKAATKILESELDSGSMGGVQSLKSSKLCLNHSKVHDTNGIIAIPRKMSMLSKSSEGIIEPGATGSVRGQKKRSPQGLKDSTIGRSFPSRNEAHSSGAKGKGKSACLANQAKVNAQRREGSSTKSGNTVVLKDTEGCSLNKPVKSLLNYQKSNQHKRASSVNGSCVLRQNNQKQNYLSSKSKLALQSTVSEQQGMKNVPGDASFEKNKVVDKLSGNAKVSCMKRGTKTADIDKDGLPSVYNPQKKSLVEQSSFFLTSVSSDDMRLGRHGKQVQHNVVMDEHSRWHCDNKKNGLEVVSFTFTSPIRKPVAESQASSHEVENWDKKNGHSDNLCQAALYSESEMLSHLKQNAIEGDCLGILLERKLRELTSGAQSPYLKFVNGGSVSAYASVIDHSASVFNESSVAPAKHKMETLFRSYDDELSSSFDSDSLSSDQAECMSYKLQEEVNRVECHSSNVDAESGHQDHNSFSHCSTESWESAHGSKMGSSSSSIQAPDMVDWNCNNKILSVESELVSSDSVSPITQNIDGKAVSQISIRGHTNSWSQELEYVKEILTNTGFKFEDLIPCPVDNSFEILDPVLFDKLEETRTYTGYEEEEKQLRMRRKMLFDSVNECLDVKCSRYFRAGYRSWAKGVAVVEKELAEDLYREISGWNCIGDWMVDELVTEDMSTHWGRWTSFEIEAFEAGIEIERGVLNSLVDDVVADFL